MNKGLDKFGLGRRQFPPVVCVDGDITQGGRAVVLNIDVGRGKQLDEDRNGTGVDQLLAVLIWCI